MKPFKSEKSFETERVSDLHQLCNHIIKFYVMIKTVLMRRQKKEIIVVLKKSQMSVKQGQHITHSDHDKSPDETAEMANGVCEKTVELEGDPW